jgi:phosphate-selective porin OprO/OprP
MACSGSRRQPGGPLTRHAAALIAFALLAVPAAAQPAPGPSPTPLPSPPPTVTADARDGFSVRSADGTNRVRVTGYGHFDGRFLAGDEALLGTDTFLLRRLRPAVSGVLAGRFEFSFMPDFGGGTAVLQDGWIDSRFWNALRLRVGKMKSPTGLERLGSATSMLFVERAYPTALLPNRDVGLQAHGEIAGGRIAYQVGVFNGVVDGGSADTDTADAKDAAGRVWLQPFRTAADSPLKGLGLGLSATGGRQTGATATYRSAGQVPIFTYATGVTADGKRRRYSPQATFVGGPVRVLVEHARSTSRLRRSSTVEDVGLVGWQVAGGVLVTGEKNGWNQVDPEDPFQPKKAGKGAVELAARYTAFEVDEETFALGLADASRAVAAAREITVGVNWWLTRTLKYVVNYSHTEFDGGAPGGADRPTEKVFFMRVQVAY